MPDLTPTTLRATVRSVVRKADARGDIDAGLFTLKTAKQQIAKALGVEIEVLNAKEWKQTVKDLVFDAIEAIETLKSSPTKRASPVKTEVAVLTHLMSDEERERRREEQRERGKGKGKVKESRRKAVHSSSESEGPSTTAPRRKKIKLDPDSDPDHAEDEPRAKPQKSRGNKVKRDSEDEQLDSEVDDVPKRKAKKRDGGEGQGKKEGKQAANGKNAAKEAKPRTLTTSSTAPIIEDERVKELKSIVVACGVRKQWKKEFQGMDTAEAQIAHLRRLLSDLGMRGQPTKGKAKAIKEKREMAAELGDVLEFEAKRGLGITRRGRPAASDRASRSPSPPARTSKARGARTNGSGSARTIASAAYVESSEEGTDLRTEEGSEDGARGGQSGGSIDEDAGHAREHRRKTVASSEDSDTE